MQDANLTRALEAILKEECRLQARYIGLLNEERRALVKMSSERVVELADQRDKLSWEMKEARDRRMEILSAIPDSKGVQLAELIKMRFSGNEAARLMALRDQLHSLIKDSAALAREISQVVNFSLDFINGSLSIIWNGTQSATSSYGRKGVVKSQASSGRAGMLTKSA